jgi:2-amino-4-hydroxy-6-hydroxymethyldihydropteridine diphosphokinase
MILNTVIIGMGSNINPRLNIRKAKQLLARQFHLAAESKFVRTKPIGLKKQNDFLNGAVLITTPLSRSRLKLDLKQIEARLGRNVSARKHYGPRTIDLDILVWNGEVVGRDFYNREFTRKSVFELMPGLNNGRRPL